MRHLKKYKLFESNLPDGKGLNAACLDILEEIKDDGFVFHTTLAENRFSVHIAALYQERTFTINEVILPLSHLISSANDYGYKLSKYSIMSDEKGIPNGGTIDTIDDLIESLKLKGYYADGKWRYIDLIGFRLIFTF